MEAVVLAGGALERDRFPGVGPGIRRKADLPILGRPMLWWTLRALRACPAVGQIVVVGDPELAGAGLAALDACVVPEAGELDGNLRAGLDALGLDAARVLVLSGDLPLLTPAALEDLLRNAPDADVVFPFVERREVERRFPGREFIFARTADGELTGCSAGLLKPAAVREQWPWVERLLAARRYSPLRLALLLGLPLALKLLTRRLTVRDVERRLSTLLRLDGRGYRTPYPELAMDVDKESDLPVVEMELERLRLAGEGG